MFLAARHVALHHLGILGQAYSWLMLQRDATI
jgi:hypothetical protein